MIEGSGSGSGRPKNIDTGSGNATLLSNFVSCETQPECYYQCCESGMFISDPTFFHPGSEVFHRGSRMPTENNFSILVFLLFTRYGTIHLHQSLKIKRHKKSQNSRNQDFSYFYFAWWWKDPDPSKQWWIREVWKLTDPNPQHWLEDHHYCWFCWVRGGGKRGGTARVPALHGPGDHSQADIRCQGMYDWLSSNDGFF